MNNFSTIYRFELKKLFQKKIVWIAAALFFAVISLIPLNSLLGHFYSGDIKYISRYELLTIDKAHERKLTGRPIDQTLLNETMQAYTEYYNQSEQLGANPTQEEILALTETHMQKCRPYKPVYDLVRKALDKNETELLALDFTAQDFYRIRAEQLQNTWRAFRLSEKEKAYWMQKEKELSTPFLYSYKTGYTTLLNAVYALSALTFLLMATALSGIFADEHSLKTDQLLLASKHGRRTLYFAKYSAGISFAAGTTCFGSALAFLLSFLTFGPEGFRAPIQLVRPEYSYPISIGQMAVLAYLILVVEAVTVSIGIMFLSEFLHSSIATLALTVGAVLSGMFLTVPGEYRFLSQLWDSLPINFLFAGNFYDIRLFSVFGKLFPTWQLLPVFYLSAGLLLIMAGRPIYQKYQVTGR